ncbi:centromere protein H [Dromiciops gliroides]|uniref:centromere protein H n=1 Tax=Dromiciops gliroides TaxID=33562 RepID=UPI001CC59E94|nr:centromere protein H [Dromiciops gliroides]
MEGRGAQTRPTTRRSNRAGVGETREEEEGVRDAQQPLRARRNSRPNAPGEEEEEEGRHATPRSCRGPKRALRSSGEEEEEEWVSSAPPRSGGYDRGKKKEPSSIQFRRTKRSGRGNGGGEEEKDDGEAVPSATPSSRPRPRRDLRSSSGRALEELGEKEEDEEEEGEERVPSATPRSGRCAPGEKEARSIQSQHAKRSGRRNARGEEQNEKKEKVVPNATPSTCPRPGRLLHNPGVSAREEEGEEDGGEAEEKVRSAMPRSGRYTLGKEKEKEKEARSTGSQRSSAKDTQEEKEAPSIQSPFTKCSGRRNAAGEEEEEEEEEAVPSTTPLSGRYTPGKEKEPRRTGPQRTKRSDRRNAGGDGEEVRSSRSGRAEHSTGKNAQGDQEDVRAKRNTRVFQNALEEDEVGIRKTGSPGSKLSLSKYTREKKEEEGHDYSALHTKQSTGRDLNLGEEEEEVRGTGAVRPRRGTGGDAKVRSATSSSTGKKAQGQREAASELGAGSLRAGSNARGDVKVREEEKHVLDSWARRPSASAPGKYVVGGEDGKAPRIRETTHQAGAGDEVRTGTSGNIGKEKLVRRSQRPAPDLSGDAENGDGSAQGALTSSSRDESPPASSYGKESGEEEKREEDEDCNMIRQLLRLKDQIKQQLLEYKAEVEASKESSTEEFTEGSLVQRIEDLEKKMEGVKIELEMKTLALKRVQVAHALQKKLEMNDSESESILAILKKILTTNSSILKAQEQTQKLEEKMLEIQKNRLLLKKAGKEKLLEIQSENKKKKDELNLLENSASLIKIKKSLQKEIDTTTIIQNVFQHIVMAAKIDWAADADLKALILQLEKNLNSI